MRPLTPARYCTHLAAAVVVLAVMFVLNLAVSQDGFSFKPLAGYLQFSEQSSNDLAILSVRCRRVITATIVGAALAGAGVAFQSLLRNPLASPFILGISSGSALGVIVYSFLTLQLHWAMEIPVHLASLVFGALTMLLVYALSRRRGQIEPLTLLLVGVIVNAFNSALIMFISALATTHQRADMAKWLMGYIKELDLTNRDIWFAGLAVLGGWAILQMQSKTFNLQALGEPTAGSLGVNVARSQAVCFFVGSLMTSAAVAVSGPIGFVGLICPHLCRAVIGPDHRLMMIWATVLGAVFVACSDTLCRATIEVLGSELPVGVVTALCGGPFFIYLLRNNVQREL